MQICYLDRIRKEQMVNVPRSFPLICVWNKQLISERVILEIASGFGKGGGKASWW